MIRFSPLLDPIRYMIGKYDDLNNKIQNLMKFMTVDYLSIERLTPLSSPYGRYDDILKYTDF